MLLELLRTNLFNLSELQRATGIRKQYISGYKNGKGLNQVNQDKLLSHITNVILPLLNMSNVIDKTKDNMSNVIHKDSKGQYTIIDDNGIKRREYIKVNI